MEFHVDGRGQTKRFVESLLPSMLEQLKLTKRSPVQSLFVAATAATLSWISFHATVVPKASERVSRTEVAA